jgi:hypothetical protein
MADKQPSSINMNAGSLTELLSMPDDVRTLALWLLRKGEATLPEAIAASGKDEAGCREILGKLAVLNFVQEVDEGGDLRYRAKLGLKRGWKMGGEVK